MASTPSAGSVLVSEQAPPDQSPARKRSRSSSSPSDVTVTNTTSTNAGDSLLSEIQALLNESMASLDEAVFRPTIPVQAGPGAGTEQQLLVALLEANQKLAKEKMEMRGEIEKLRSQLVQLSTTGMEAENVTGVERIEEGEEKRDGEKRGCEECEASRQRVVQAEEELRSALDEMSGVKHELAACKTEMEAWMDELQGEVKVDEDISVACQM